ncbi:MAG: phage tail sheath subtilisin-like domain-containing protein [Chromatiales bacterium]
MAEMILPGVYIEVRPEGLITPGRVTVGNVGVVGTASKGPVGQAVIVGTYTEARQRFGAYDSFIDPSNNQPRQDSLTLVRALEQIFGHGATTVFAVRVAGGTKAKASYELSSATGPCVTLNAKTEGDWGNGLSINVAAATDHAYIEDEAVPTSGAGALTLRLNPVVQSARNRIRHRLDATNVTRSLKIVYDPTAPAAGEVQINRTTGVLTFLPAETPAPADTVTASYLVDKSKAVKVTLRLGQADEVYTVVDGTDLTADINQRTGGSVWVDATPGANAAELPLTTVPATEPPVFAAFKGGNNGAAGADYKEGLEKLLNEDAHIMVAAGQDDSFGDELDSHCQVASSDAIRRDRIAVVGSRLGATLEDLRGHNLASDRLIFVAPGIKTTDAVSKEEVTLPGAYAAGAVAGLLASFSAHISLTNKTVQVGGLEQRYTSAELTQLVLNRVLALEARQGFRIVKGITTSTNTAWHQITTRRIVDFAKFGVRSASNPYIGLLNNERVRAALRATINSFLTEMVDDEKLISYELEVTATRDEEIKGIARVTMVLRATFSIDFIKVTMFLE